MAFRGTFPGFTARGPSFFCILSPAKSPVTFHEENKHGQELTHVYSINIILHYIVAHVRVRCTYTFHWHPSPSTDIIWTVMTPHCDFAKTFALKYNWLHRQTTTNIIVDDYL